MIIAGASAYPRTLDFARFRQIADSVGALFLVDMAHISGLVAAGLHPNPCQYADIVTSTTHKTLRGPRAGIILAKEKFGAAIDKTVFPGMQGGPLVHVIAAKAVCFLEAMQPEFVDLPEAGGGQRQGAGAEPDGRRLPRGLRRHRHAPDAGGRVLQGGEAARKRKRPWTAPASPSTRTPFLSTSTSRSTPAASAWAPRRSPRADSRRPRCGEVGALIAEVLHNIGNEETIASVRRKVGELTARFPLYNWKLDPVRA